MSADQEVAINAKYDNIKALIEAKEITDEYTQEDKDNELKANEEARQKALDNAEADFDTMLANMFKENTGFSGEYVDMILENIDFSVPDPVEIDNDVIEDRMYKLSLIADNCKYVYLTMPSKYEALNKLSDSEYDKYAAAYDSINAKYDELKTSITAKQLITPYTQEDKDNEIAAIVAKEITDEYTQEDKDNDIAAIEAKELIEGYTQTDKDNELANNETTRDAEIKTLNDNYMNTMTTIGIALTALKTDNETGFSGDVHVNGKLHVDEDVNLEGKLNNISISDILTQEHLIAINTSIASKADNSHKHKIADIEDYKAYDDTAIKADITSNTTKITTLQNNINTINTSLNNKVDSTHTHTNINNNLSINGNITFPDSGTNTREIRFTAGGNDYGRIAVGATATNSGWMEIATADDISEPIYVRQYRCNSGGGTPFNTVGREAILLGADGNTSFPGNITAKNITTLQNTVNTNTTDIASNTTKITTLQNMVDEHTTQIYNKADSTHKHKLADIEDYKEPEAYDDTEIKASITSNTTNITSLQSNINTINTTLNNKVDRNINLDIRVSAGGGKNAIIFGPLTSMIHFKGYIDILKSGIGCSSTVELEYNVKEKKMYVLNLKYIQGGNMGSGLSWGHTYPLEIRLYNEEPYLLYHQYTCQSWLSNTANFYGIGNISTDNFKIVAQSLLSIPEEEIITVIQTTSDQDRITELETNKADSTHTHKIADIEDYKEYDDTAIKADITNNTTNITSLQNTVDEHTTQIANKADLEHKHKMTDIEDYKTALLEFLYPVGSIYLSMNYASPGNFLGGVWKKIEDRFLFSVSDKTMGVQGGSKKITVENLPAHTHGFTYLYEIAKDRNGNPDGAADSGNNRYYWRYGSEYVEGSGSTAYTGSGTDYMPPYITVHAWYRTE